MPTKIHPSEQAIRKAIRAHPAVQEAKEKGARVIEELGLHYGASRADLAVISDEGLIGFEIKSHLDTLKRLPAQIELYSAVFDRCSLVCAPKHVGKALALLPPWWGLWVAETDEWGQTVLAEKRSGIANEHPDALTRTQLLWKEELTTLLQTYKAYEGLATVSAEILRYRVVRRLAPDVIHQFVGKTLRERQNWRRAFKGDAA